MRNDVCSKKIYFSDFILPSGISTNEDKYETVLK
jgi:hypothetical protein